MMTPPRTWSPRLSLRTSLAVIGVCAVWIGLYARSAREQAKAVAWVQSQSGNVQYDVFYDDQYKDYQAPAWWKPTWMRDKVGDQYIGVVTIASIQNRELSDVAPLAMLTGLRGLALHGNELTDLAPLFGLKRLDVLWLSENEISDIGPLRELSRLRRLFIGGNQISDVSALSSLKELRSLDLSSNRVTDVSPLASLSTLKELSLENNPVRDFSPLLNLHELQMLNVRGTDIEPELVEQLRAAHPNARLIVE